MFIEFQNRDIKLCIDPRAVEAITPMSYSKDPEYDTHTIVYVSGNGIDVDGKYSEIKERIETALQRC